MTDQADPSAAFNAAQRRFHAALAEANGLTSYNEHVATINAAVEDYNAAVDAYNLAYGLTGRGDDALLHLSADEHVAALVPADGSRVVTAATDPVARLRAATAEHIAQGRLSAPWYAEADVTAVLDELEQLRTWLDELGYDALSVKARLRKTAEQQSKPCPCGCPHPGLADMCCCPQPCPCDPDCAFCGAPPGA